jgi:hypothetical protein
MKLYFGFLLMIAITANSQKITQSQIDKFTKQRRIETGYVALRGGLGTGIGAKIRSVDTSAFIILVGHGRGTGVIGLGDPAIILLDNDSTVIVTSTGVQTYDIGDYENSYQHQYRISLEGIEKLKGNDVKSIRRYITDEYSDLDIPKNNAGKLRKLAEVFLREYNKKV